DSIASSGSRVSQLASVARCSSPPSRAFGSFFPVPSAIACCARATRLGGPCPTAGGPPLPEGRSGAYVQSMTPLGTMALALLAATGCSSVMEAVQVAGLGHVRKLRERPAGAPASSPERPGILLIALDGVDRRI